MFTIPTIPTDSLYKFLFVGGIILMIAAPYLFIQQARYEISTSNRTDSFLVNNLAPKVLKRITTLDSSNRIKDEYILKLKNINHSINTYSKQMMKISKKENLSSKDILNYKILKSKTDHLFKTYYNNKVEFNKNFEDTMQSHSLDKLIIARLKDFEINIKNEKATNNTIYFLLWCMLTLGVFFTLQGILRWYLYLQMPQDRLLKIQVELAEIELNNKRKAVSTDVSS